MGGVDSAILTAARALSLGDPLSALKHVALRGDASALALRGIAMAQLGEWVDARSLLRRAARRFGAAEPVAHARCIVAQAEVALALRDLTYAEQNLDNAVSLLARRGELANAALARLVQVRRLTLLGQLESAERELGKLSSVRVPPRVGTLRDLAAAELALKRGDAVATERCLRRARVSALKARIPALLTEIERAERQLEEPVARVLERGVERPVALRELGATRAKGLLVVDACRRDARLDEHVVSLITRPTLFELLVALAEAAPRDVPRDALVLRVFGARRINDSHRVRLRVEIGRLRKQLRTLAGVRATPAGFELTTQGRECLVVLPPDGSEASALLALLRGGDAWPTSALAAALGKSQRAVQRALRELEQDGRVHGLGAGRARRWVAASPPGFATSMLLVTPGSLG